jgi:hypothetical protein
MRKNKMMDPKEEVGNELNELALEVLHRLEYENPELLKSLFLSPEEEQVPKSKK